MQDPEALAVERKRAALPDGVQQKDKMLRGVEASREEL
jgi:hypothetical protein